MNSSIKEFGAKIQRLINKEDLSRQETYEMFREILMNNQPEIQQGAFLAALVSKGESVDEIVGVWQAIDEIDTVHVEGFSEYDMFENSGTGMDQLKTFNVSSASAIVASSCGVRIARHGARAITSRFGTVDILESVGIDVNCPINVVENSIRNAGIGLFNGMSPEVHPSALGRILSQTAFGTTLNIAASLANPCRPRMGLRGVYSEEIIDKVAEVMREIGYRRAMIVHGKDSQSGKGMDEISVCGGTDITELSGSSTTRHRIFPEDMDINRVGFDEIASTNNAHEETSRFIRVIAGKGSSACTDFTALNAGAILYTAGLSDSIKKGIEMSLSAIYSKRALSKLREWVLQQNTSPNAGMSRLERVARDAGLSFG